MISLIDVIRGLSGWIEANFDEPPTTKDITEGFSRPCTYVQPIEISSQSESDLLHDTFRFEIIRFSDLSYRGYLSLLNYQKKFSELLAVGYIPINSQFMIYPTEIDFELDREDMYLSVTFSVDNYQLMTITDTHPAMDKLLIDNQTAYEEDDD